MQDLPTIRRACQPVARWWDDYLTTGQADPDSLDQALVDARALGPVPGRLGEALAYIIAGCLPNLNYADASAAFDRVAAVGRGATIEALDTIATPSPLAQPGAAAASTTPGQQLAFPGITAASTPTRNNRSSHS
jgi:hypothetical protein